DDVLIACQHLAKRDDADARRILLPHGVLERGAETRSAMRIPRILTAPSAALKSVAPDEIRLLLRQVSEPRDVHPRRPPIVVRRFAAGKRHEIPARAGSHDVLAEVVADDTGRVRRSIRVDSRL